MSAKRALRSLLCMMVLLGGWLSAGPALAEDATPVPAATAPAAAQPASQPDGESLGGKILAGEPEPEAPAKDAAPSNVELSYAIDNLILFLAAVLVLFMQAGFAMLEAGFNAAKNTVNILFKNVMDVSVGALLFWVIGYNLMYPGDYADKVKEGQDPEWNGYIAAPSLGGIEEKLDTAEVAPAKLHPQSDWLFQVAFAATAATIVSGAVAGRMKFGAYLIYSAVLTAIVYPVSGSWKWGNGWLEAAGFHDFAGSLVVHAVGGFAGLAGAIVLGSRIGRFTKEGKSHAMPGHNMGMAALGVFILWIGWYGFNPGSQLAFSGQANTDATMLIAVNTTLAAAAGAVGAMLLAWVLYGKPDLSMALNGVLAGLVGITANCDCVSNPEAMLIGAAAGGLVVLGIIALDKLRIDDPVGAFPVHGLCGVWGGIATGLFGAGKDLGAQLLGSAAIAAWAFAAMFVLFSVLKAAGVLRVSPEEEMQGLDIGEHGMHAYTLETA